MSAPKQAAEKPIATTGLVGRCFHVFGEDNAVQYQGHILAKITESLYLVQYFEWITGCADTMALVSIDDMVTTAGNACAPGKWQFYRNSEHMNDWYEHTGIHAAKRRDEKQRKAASAKPDAPKTAKELCREPIAPSDAPRLAGESRSATTGGSCVR